MLKQTLRLDRAAIAMALALGGAAVVAGVAACDRDTVRTDAERTAGADADNTARNVRDRDDRTVTPLEQGASEGDRTITAHIRQAIVENDALSTNAHNVKIITQDGVVTLRGPVDSPQEKATIVAAAQTAPGVKRVDDQLEVTATN